VKTGQLPSFGNIVPSVLKKLLDEHIRRNRNILSEQKTQLFDVLLVYHSSSEKMKVKSNSFHGAAWNAMMHRSSGEIPKNVRIRRIKEA
jgi:hypothetical protein